MKVEAIIEETKSSCSGGGVFPWFRWGFPWGFPLVFACFVFRLLVLAFRFFFKKKKNLIKAEGVMGGRLMSVVFCLEF